MFGPEGRLSAEEERLVQALRRLPPGEVRRAFVSLLDELAAFVGAPSCPEMQADGAPCESVDRLCDHCRKAALVLDRLRSEVPHSPLP